VPRQLH